MVISSIARNEVQRLTRDKVAATLGLVVLLLITLSIILAGYRSITGEKESGMYRFLKSQGISKSRVIAGMTLGLWAVILLLFLPFLLIGLIILLFIIFPLWPRNSELHSCVSLTWT